MLCHSNYHSSTYHVASCLEAGRQWYKCQWAASKVTTNVVILSGRSGQPNLSGNGTVVVRTLWQSSFREVLYMSSCACGAPPAHALRSKCTTSWSTSAFVATITICCPCCCIATDRVRAMSTLCGCGLCRMTAPSRMKRLYCMRQKYCLPSVTLCPVWKGTWQPAHAEQSQSCNSSCPTMLDIHTLSGIQNHNTHVRARIAPAEGPTSCHSLSSRLPANKSKRWPAARSNPAKHSLAQ